MTAPHVAALGRVAHLLAESRDTAGTVRAVAEEGIRVFGAERAGVYLFEPDGQGVRAVVTIGLSAAYVATLQARFREAAAAPRVLQGEPAFLEDVRADPDSPLHALVVAEGFVSLAALPLRHAGQAIGWLAFYHDRRRAYSEAERVLARAFADQAALAIGMRRLVDTVVRIKTEWQTAFDGTGNGLALVDHAGRIERANRFVADLAGVPVTELRGTPVQRLFQDWPAAGQDPLAMSRARGERVSRFLEAGAGQFLAVTASPRAEGGFVVSMDDLTHYVRLEERYARLVDTVHDAIVLTGPGGQVIFANPAATRLFGVPAPDLMGTTLDQLLPHEGGSVQAGALRYEALVRREDGVRIADVSVVPLAERGEAMGHVAVIRDVTAERLATEALRRSERRYRALFNRAPLAIFTLDRVGRFLSANRAAFRLVGLTSPPQGARLDGFVVPGEWHDVETELERSFLGETREIMFHFRRTDGAVRQAAMVAVPVEERGGLRAVLVIARDVTDEAELRERLTQSEKMAALGALVSGVAHELNNPLAGIAAMAQALQFESAGGDLVQGLETVRREAMRAARIVSDLLTFARLRPLTRRETDLNVVVRETFASTPALAEHGVVWTLGLDPTLPSVNGDPDQIRQVVTNLLVNAAHAMRESARREGLVRTWWDAEWAGFEVLDTGAGIPADVVSRVFEPFFTTKAQGQGTGLGLSISHGILRAHGGEIRGENRPEGGARFAFRLPRDPARIGRTVHA